MKVSDFRRRVDFRALLSTHQKMIHKLGAINQQHLAENGHGSKVLKARGVPVKTLCSNHLFSTFARALATMATNLNRSVSSQI